MKSMTHTSSASLSGKKAPSKGLGINTSKPMMKNGGKPFNVKMDTPVKGTVGNRLSK